MNILKTTTLLLAAFFASTYAATAQSKTTLPNIKANAPQTKYMVWGKEPVEAQYGPTDTWTWTHMMCDGPQSDNTKASSTLAPQGKVKYSANNVCDDNPNTAWVEGNVDYGIGEYLEFKEWVPMGEGTISILNGYQSSKASWGNNSRVKKIKLSINGKDYCTIELSDVMGVQTIDLPSNILKIIQGESKVVNSNSEVPEGAASIIDESGKIEYTIPFKGSFRFTIMEVYPGLKWKDTAISGIFSCGG
jgi:hypothetical protein